MSQPQEKGRYLFFDPFLCWPALRADPVEKALMQKIVAEPDEDLPRLIYADWLEERGDPRGNFIRLQCELTLRGSSGSVQFARTPTAVLEAQLQALWAGQRQHLAGPWKPPGLTVGLNAGPLRFHRGIPALFIPVHPWGSNQHSPLEFWLWGRKLTDSGVQALACCAELAQVEDLTLTGNRVRTPGVRAIADSPYLHRLNSLDLRLNKIRAGGLKALVRSPHLPALESLDLSGNLLGQEGLRMLHRWMSLPKLEKLYLYNTGIGRDDLTGLRRSPRFQRITIYP